MLKNVRRSVNLKQFWVKICVTLEIRVACKRLALESFFYFYSSSIQGKGDIHLHDILQFITGTPSIPCLGFQNKLEVNFVHDCEKLRDKECNCKPTVSTCALSLNLTIHIKSIPEMTQSMTEAVRWSYGFGKV